MRLVPPTVESGVTVPLHLSHPCTQNPDYGHTASSLSILKVAPCQSHLSPVGRFWSVELQSQQPSPNHVEPVHVDYVFCVSSLKAKDPGGWGDRDDPISPMLQHLQSCPVWGLGHHPSSPLFLLQHLGVEAEVEAHTLGPAFFVAGGNGAEFAIPCLSTSVPALNLEGGPRTQESGPACVPPPSSLAP